MGDRRRVFVIFGVICFAAPENTFAALADILGFLFLTVGIWWTIEALSSSSARFALVAERLGGILMCILAFWTAASFFSKGPTHCWSSPASGR